MSSSISSKRIICEATPDVPQWSAWFADAEELPEFAHNARTAVEQLLESHFHYETYIDDLAEDVAACRRGHLELIARDKAECLECRGSGQYIGFTVVEDCRACGGSGSRLPPRVDVIKAAEEQRKIVRMSLRRRGFSVRAFETLDAFFDQLVVSPDCIVSGMLFPGGGVPEIVFERDQRGITAPIVVLTSHPDLAELLGDDVFAIMDEHDTSRDDWVSVVEEAVSTHRAARA